MEMKDLVKIFRAFPLFICQGIWKIKTFNGYFKNYHMTKSQILNVCMNSGGMLASKDSNFKGVFDTLKIQGLSAKDVLSILDIYPEFALQNRQQMLLKKILYI